MILIHLYASNGKLEEVLKELNEGVDINLKCDMGETALHRAAIAGHIDIVRLLLKKEADIYIQSTSQNTPLYSAVLGLVRSDNLNNINHQAKYMEIFKLLLTHEKQLRQKNPEQYKDKPLFKDIKNKHNLTPVARLGQSSKELQLQLEQLIEEINPMSSATLEIAAPLEQDNSSSIHLYAELGELERVKQALTKIDINIKTELTGSTALHQAVRGGHVDIVKFLLEKGADIYIQDNHKDNVLHVAVLNLVKAENLNDNEQLRKYFDIFRLLLTHEMQLRKNNPEQYRNIPWLKETKNKYDLTAQERLGEVSQSLQLYLGRVINKVEKNSSNSTDFEINASHEQSGLKQRNIKGKTSPSIPTTPPQIRKTMTKEDNESGEIKEHQSISVPENFILSLGSSIARGLGFSSSQPPKIATEERQLLLNESTVKPKW